MEAEPEQTPFEAVTTQTSKLNMVRLAPPLPGITAPPILY